MTLIVFTLTDQLRHRIADKRRPSRFPDRGQAHFNTQAATHRPLVFIDMTVYGYMAEHITAAWPECLVTDGTSVSPDMAQTRAMTDPFLRLIKSVRAKRAHTVT